VTFSRAARRLTAAALGVAAVAGGAVGAGAPAQASSGGAVYRITPADIAYGPTAPTSLATRMHRLRPGDTLVLGPGVYEAGYTRPNVTKGTKDAPITVVAEQPSKTLIKGLVKMFDADHWHLRNLRVQATQPGFEALYMGGGVGWVVSGGEFFGARATNAYANVTIGSGTAGNANPRGFRFTGNCVHGAALSYRVNPTRINTDHNIYVNFAGSAHSGGRIERNVIFDAPNGTGVKLGYSGEPNSLGPWNVKVEQNTIVANGRQVLLHANVRNNLVVGNILGYSTKRFMKDPRTTALYANMLTTSTNRFHHNYVYASSMIEYDPGNRLTDAGSNQLRKAPRFTAVNTCAAWKTSTRIPWGRYGTGRY
jgi:hypothetical protein